MFVNRMLLLAILNYISFIRNDWFFNLILTFIFLIIALIFAIKEK